MGKRGRSRAPERGFRTPEGRLRPEAPARKGGPPLAAGPAQAGVEERKTPKGHVETIGLEVASPVPSGNRRGAWDSPNRPLPCSALGGRDGPLGASSAEGPRKGAAHGAPFDGCAGIGPVWIGACEARVPRPAGAFDGGGYPKGGCGNRQVLACSRGWATTPVCRRHASGADRPAPCRAWSDKSCPPIGCASGSGADVSALDPGEGQELLDPCRPVPGAACRAGGGMVRGLLAPEQGGREPGFRGPVPARADPPEVRAKRA
jgi:hypothetical protein